MKHIRSRHYAFAAVLIGVAAWSTHELTQNIGGSPLWNQNAIAKFYPEQVEAIQESAAFSLVEDANAYPTLEVFTPSHNALVNTAESEHLEQEPQWPNVREVKIRSGDTLGRIFQQQGFDLRLPHVISQHEIASALVKLSIGRTLTFYSDDTETLRRISYPTSALAELIVNIDDGEIVSAAEIPLTYEVVRQQRSGVISSSLYETAQAQGIGIAHIMDMVRIFGWDIDFVLDIRTGDEFHMIYEDFVLDGEKIADGPLIAAEFTTQGETFRAFRFDNGEGQSSYFAPSGDSMLGTFLRSPVEFSRVSSRFGQRKHPILKTWRAHKGVDYAAPTGTPIRATADGKVTHAGNKGGYGKTVILTHADRFSTLYAHMSGYAKGIRRGARVSQGQVIGYIGSTGRVTGPHLHYEFRLDGVHRNPLTFKTPKATAVKPELEDAFMDMAARLSAELDALRFANNRVPRVDDLGAE